MVQTAASPFSKKSCPLVNISAFHGLSYGTVNVSITSGPVARPVLPLVTTSCFQWRAPPFVNRSSDRGLKSRTSLAKLDTSFFGPRQTITAVVVDFVEAV